MMILPKRIRYQSRFVFWSLSFFYAGIVWIMRLCLIPVSYEGNYKKHSKEPVIFVANHQSSIDIPLLGLLAQAQPHVWLARHELMTWYLLRWVLPRLAVVINVSSHQKAMASLLRLVRLVRDKNIDVMVFPEGSRYPDEKVHKFYGGFVTLAKLLKRPVVPVAIVGINHVYPPNSFWVYKHPVRVVVGEPFTMKEGESDKEFKQRVHQWFVEQVES